MITPVLPKFVEAYPDIVVEVLIEQTFTNIVKRRLDAGIRLGESPPIDSISDQYGGGDFESFSRSSTAPSARSQSSRS